MWLWLLLLSVAAVHRVASRNYDIVFVSIEGYEANAEYMGPGSFIRIRRTDKSSLPSLYHVANITKALPENTVVEVVIYEMRDNKIVPSWLKYKNNFCDYVTKEKRPIFDALAKMYKFNHCPILGVYKLENWRPDDQLLPPVLPGPDKMMFGLQLASGKTNILKYGVLFSVDRFKGVRGGQGGGGGGGPRPG